MDALVPRPLLGIIATATKHSDNANRVLIDSKHNRYAPLEANNPNPGSEIVPQSATLGEVEERHTGRFDAINVSAGNLPTSLFGDIAIKRL
jgi:hypothetical protein